MVPRAARSTKPLSHRERGWGEGTAESVSYKHLDSAAPSSALRAPSPRRRRELLQGFFEMSEMKPLLIELGTEELPVKALPGLAQAFFDGVIDALRKRGIDFDRTDAKPLY